MRKEGEGGKCTQSCLGKLKTEFGDIVPVGTVVFFERLAVDNDIGEFGDVH